MRRSKRLIIIAVLTVLVLGATLGGFAVAQADDENTETTETANVSTFIQKVAEIYENNTGVAINPEELQQAIIEAKEAMKEAALDNYLDKLVEEGKITEEQAEDYKAWLEAKPDLPIEEFKEWWEARPDVPGLFGWSDENGLGPFGKLHGIMNKVRGGFGMKFYSWCTDNDEVE